MHWIAVRLYEMGDILTKYYLLSQASSVTRHVVIRKGNIKCSAKDMKNNVFVEWLDRDYAAYILKASKTFTAPIYICIKIYCYDPH